MAQTITKTKRSNRRRASDQLMQGGAAVTFLEPIKQDAEEADRVEVSGYAGEFVEVAKPTAPDAPEAVEVLEEKRSKPKESKMSLTPFSDTGKSAIAVMSPDKLKELAFISTYDSVDPQSTSPRQHGYQRNPMESRFPGIARYYDKNDNRHRIPALIASARIYSKKDQVRFNFLFNRGEIDKIHKEFGRTVFSIVDGQHRLGGLYWGWKNIDDFNADIPVTIHYGLNYAEEAEFFDTINTNQRKLPKALIEATKVHMEAGEKSQAQFIREVSFALAQDGDSVWNGLVNMTGARDPKLPVSFEGLRRATQNMLNERVSSRLRARGLNPEDVAKKYWELVARTCETAWNNRPNEVWNSEGEIVEEPTSYRIKDLVGVAALSKLGADIFSTSLDRTKTDKEFWGSVTELVSKLGSVDWEKKRGNPWMATSAGFAGMSQLNRMLYDLVYLDQAPGVAVEMGEKA